MQGRTTIVAVGMGLLVVACGSSGADGAKAAAGGPPVFDITDPGTGDTNLAPLFPLHAGTSVDGMRIRGERDIEGRHVFEVGLDGEPSALAGFDRKYYSESDDGVLYEGTFNAGLFPRPVLIVPKTVRAGMKWTADPGGGAKPTQCSAEAGTAPQGGSSMRPARQWHIVCSGGPAAWSGELSEGVGLQGAVVDLRSGPAYPVDSHPMSKLEPWNGGQPIFSKFFPHRVGSISMPDEARKRRIVIDGEVATFSTGGVVDLGDPSNDMAVMDYLPHKARACLSFDGATFAQDDSLDSEEACPDPLSAAVGGDGKLRYIPPGNYCLEHGDRCSTFDFYAIRGDADGAEVLVHSDSFYSARYHDGVDGNRFYTIDEPTRRLGDKPGGLGLLDLHPYWLLFGKAGSQDESLIIPNKLGSYLYAGSWDGHWHDPHPAFVPGALSASLSKQERDLLDVTPDGTISRITVKAGVLELTFLAHVALPKGHAAVGAIDAGDQLIVFTHGDYLGWSTQIIPGTDPPQSDTRIEPDLGKIYAWTVTPPAAGDPEPPPAERTPIYTEPAARDLRVCTSEPWSKAKSLTLGDMAPAAVVETDQYCALLVRDPSDASPIMPNGFDADGLQLFEGDLPRLGHVRVTGGTVAPDVTWPVIESGSNVVPLSGGGFVSTVSPWHVYGPGGVLDSYVDGIEGGEPIADAAGNGFWMNAGDTTDCLLANGCANWMLMGHERQDFKLKDIKPSTVNVAMGTLGVVGGGVLGPTGTFVLRPNDKLQQLAEPSGLAPGGKFNIGGVLEDGTACGQTQESVVAQGTTQLVDHTICITPSGKVTTAPDTLIAYPPYYATADGVFYAVAAGTVDQLLLFDPKAMSVTAIPPADLRGPYGSISVNLQNFVHDAQGELFTWFPIVPAPTAQTLPLLLHLTKQGVELISLPTVPDLMFSMNRVAIDEKMFLFFGPPGARDGVFRVLR